MMDNEIKICTGDAVKAMLDQIAGAGHQWMTPIYLEEGRYWEDEDEGDRHDY